MYYNTNLHCGHIVAREKLVNFCDKEHFNRLPKQEKNKNNIQLRKKISNYK